jgi:hypothetical protein
MRLSPGDSLQLDSDGERITMAPIRSQARLKKELGIWVYQGEPTDVSIVELIDEVRQKTMLGQL